MKVYLQALGCKTNQYELEALAQELLNKGFETTDDLRLADVYVLNTCSVTAEAGRKCKQILRRFRHYNPEGLVVAMGCHAQLTDLSSLADISCGTSGRAELPNLISAYLTGEGYPADQQLPGPSEDRTYEDLGSVVRQAETRAQVKIQDGCNQHCSYCAIRMARGKSRSRSRARIKAEVEELARLGYKEIVLTGIHICSFEAELGKKSTALAELVLELDQVPGIERIRLGSLEPLSIGPEFIALAKQSRKLCPQFHLSLQAGSDATLKRMRRRYRTDQYRKIVAGLREAFPGCAITTDVMVAFPGETDRDFQESLSFCREIAFARMHIFRYSLREGTEAAQMTQVDPAVGRKRASAMQELADELSLNYAKGFLGKELNVLLETVEDTAAGYSDEYLRCYWPKEAAGPVNQIYRIKVDRVDHQGVYGHPV